jgi:hypothetical protein
MRKYRCQRPTDLVHASKSCLKIYQRQTQIETNWGINTKVKGCDEIEYFYLLQFKTFTYIKYQKETKMLLFKKKN